VPYILLAVEEAEGLDDNEALVPVADILACRVADTVFVLPALKLTDAAGDCVDEGVFSVLAVAELLADNVGTPDGEIVPLVDNDMVGESVVVTDKEVEPLAD
jgi:hypothetical protein